MESTSQNSQLSNGQLFERERKYFILRACSTKVIRRIVIFILSFFYPRAIWKLLKIIHNPSRRKKQSYIGIRDTIIVLFIYLFKFDHILKTSKDNTSLKHCKTILPQRKKTDTENGHPKYFVFLTFFCKWPQVDRGTTNEKWAQVE